MIYAYIRISTNVQDRENQKYSILKFADENKKKLVVDEWWEETISSRVSLRIASSVNWSGNFERVTQ